MKSIKILSLLAAFFFVGSTAIFAQTNADALSDEQRAQMEENIEAFTTELNLTDEQKTEFEAITQKYALQMVDVKDGGGSRYSKYKKVKGIRKNRNAEMKELLTDEQYDLYLEKQEEIQAKMKEKFNQK